ncbi:MAG TPA: class I SAM-dependent methyltransferase [Candidatus Eisenbacteria bacterium]|nr:class I SAM-dependent methyltransferase [Candidatus Eisenbacteria bacterium]
MDRIKAVYLARDTGRPRNPAIAEAYRRLNAERLEQMAALIRTAAPPPDGRILDVGCGAGYDLSRWVEAGWASERLAGVDLSAKRVERARQALPTVDIRHNNGTELPYADDGFDVATAVTVFSSILERALRRTLFAEMQRVVRPGGLVIVYDFVIRKPTNSNVRGLSLKALGELGRPPDGSMRLSPLLQLVAAGALIHPRLTELAWRLAPPTHRLSWWRVVGQPR